MTGTLEELEDGNWVYRGSKYIDISYEFCVWAGSITSREGWTTTPTIFGWFEDDGIYFVTVNKSVYRIV